MSNILIPFPDIGSQLTIGNAAYTVCHIDEANEYVYVILSTYNNQYRINWAGSGTVDYATSRMRIQCESYLSVAIPENFQPLLVTIDQGAGCPVFILTADQVQGDFEYFSTDENRKFYNATGTGTAPWVTQTLTDDGTKVISVATDGTMSTYVLNSSTPGRFTLVLDWKQIGTKYKIKEGGTLYMAQYYNFKPIMTQDQTVIEPVTGQVIFDYVSGALRVDYHNQTKIIGAIKAVANLEELRQFTQQEVYEGELVCVVGDAALYFIDIFGEPILINKSVKFVQTANELINMTVPSDTEGQLFVVTESLSLMSYINNQWETLGGATDVGVRTITAENNSITIGRNETDPTIGVNISPDANNALSLRVNGLYASQPTGVAKIGYFTIPNGTNGNYTLTHNYNTSTIIVQAYGATSKKSVWLDYTVTNANSLTISFSTALTEALTVVIVHA